ncbi:MAG: 16S rRNA (uracil(1498)-N(3))-methyltransferase [Planctomycetota bacterium]
MNLILLEPADFTDEQRARLSGRRHRHVTQVLRAKPGDRLRVGLIGGHIGTGVVVAIDSESVELFVTLTGEAPPSLPMTLLLAMPRPKVLRRLLADIATLGLARLVLLETWRVEKSYWQTPLLEPDAIRENLLQGLEQGGTTRLPEVLIRRRFKPFVEDELSGLAEGSRGFVAHPESERACSRGVTGPITLAIGPEGGFTDYEVGRFRDLGFEAISAGNHILRVETAVPFLVGRLI